jgi:hypothetical protein
MGIHEDRDDPILSIPADGTCSSWHSDNSFSLQTTAELSLVEATFGPHLCSLSLQSVQPILPYQIVVTFWCPHCGTAPWTTTEKRESSKAVIPHSSRRKSFQNGYPILAKCLRSLAQVIVWQRSSTFQFPSTDKDIELRCVLDIRTLQLTHKQGGVSYSFRTSLAFPSLRLADPHHVCHNLPCYSRKRSWLPPRV